MKTYMDAYEAYGVTLNNIETIKEREFDEVYTKITKAMSNGEFSLYTYLRNDVTIAKLRQLGYTVDREYSYDIDKIYKISWEIK